MIIDLRQFIETERKIWDELSQRIQRLETDPNTPLSVADAERIYYLYERTSAALVRITTFAAEPSLVLSATPEAHTLGAGEVLLAELEVALEDAVLTVTG